MLKVFVVGAILVLLFFLSFLFPSLINVMAGIITYYLFKAGAKWARKNDSGLFFLDEPW